MIDSGIGDALFTKAQQRVLGLFFGQPDRSFYLNEVVRLAAMGRGAIGRELSKLSAVGLLTLNKQGNQTHYQANPNSPIFQELKHIVVKTFGITGLISIALEPMFPQLAKAFIYGSIAKGEDNASSDVDVMLVGENLSYSEVMELLEPIEKQLQRSVNPTLYSPLEFSKRLAEKQNFLTKVMKQPQLDLIGDYGSA